VAALHEPQHFADLVLQSILTAGELHLLIYEGSANLQKLHPKASELLGMPGVSEQRHQPEERVEARQEAKPKDDTLGPLFGNIRFLLFVLCLQLLDSLLLIVLKALTMFILLVSKHGLTDLTVHGAWVSKGR
jgi:hypothetical protein